ncbi:RPAP1-like protein [Ancylostoma caninum]|uniref:RPAP1-like protein n=1 Tax=Ancylostoma caninum TaxID=29170 RepID=A0A368GKH5_ANCCA|nr:RPAP1-like protein [Ancylostoma caninum]
MNVTIDSEDGGSHRYRKNMVYKSLRRSSSQIMTNIKKKLSDAENSVRYRRALRPLNESRSPSPVHGQMRVVAPAHAIQRKNVYSTPKASSKVLAGYEFDHDSNILRTPNQSATPVFHPKKAGIGARLREMALRRPLKKSPRSGSSPSESRLSKQLARAKIREIQSPKALLLSPALRDSNPDGTVILIFTLKVLTGWFCISFGLLQYVASEINENLYSLVFLLCCHAHQMEDRNIFLKRPTANDTEEDILAMQAEWEAKKARQSKPSVQIHRVKGKSATSLTSEEAQPKPRIVKAIPSRNFEQGGRFFIDLDKITEEWSNQVLFDVEERNADWLESDRSDELARQGFEKLQYSVDDGFPEVLDLSAYYKKDAEVKRNAGGRSFFAAEFDRLHGRIEEAIPSVEDEQPSIDTEDNFAVENDKYLASLDQEKINELRQEIAEKINPATIAFLKNRHNKKENTKEAAKPTGGILCLQLDFHFFRPTIHSLKEKGFVAVSKFKASRKAAPTPTTTKEAEEMAPPAPPPPPPIVQDMLDQLEVLDEFSDRADEEKYNRLATDAVQLDFATKCLRSVAPRQQKNAVKLFDNCKNAPSGSKDPILEIARSRIDDIKELYLEQIKSGDETYFQFAAGVNPLVDGSWTLVPVRRVLDAVHKREGEVCQDDVDIVRLALLWTLLLHDERLTAFMAFADANDIYVRLAEVLLVGRDVLADDIIAACYSRLLTGYVLKAAADGRLCLRMDSRVAGLDAFMPFYEDLLVHFEEYSLGDVSFARTLLIGAYLNSAVGDR